MNNTKKVYVPTDYQDIEITVRADSIDDAAVIRELFDENVYHLHNNFLIDSAVIMDIGANIGAFTLNVLLRAKENNVPVTIYAVEPEPHNQILFNQNMDDNKWLIGDSKVILMPYALTKKSYETVKITDSQGGSKLSDEGSEVETRTLKDVMDFYKIDKLDFLKIDIEGSEIEVLKSTPVSYLKRAHRTAIEFDEYNQTQDFLDVVKKFMDYSSFYTLGVPARGCYIYTENHKWQG